MAVTSLFVPLPRALRVAAKRPDQAKKEDTHNTAVFTYRSSRAATVASSRATAMANRATASHQPLARQQ